MKGKAWSKTLAALLALAVASLAVAVGGARAVGGAGQGSIFTDPAGDSSGAPDVTSVSVANDPSSGAITVGVTATGYGASTAPLTMVCVYVDTDRNAATGSGTGSEIVLVAAKDSTGFSWDIDRWDGGQWQSVPQQAGMSFSRSGDVLTWTVLAKDIGVGAGFALRVVGGTGNSDGSPISADLAPDSGTWAYTMATQPPPPTTTTPAQPRPRPSSR